MLRFLPLMKHTLIVSLSWLLVFSVSCSAVSEGKRPELEILIGASGDPADTDDATVDEHFSAAIIPGTGLKDYVKMVFQNIGNEDLIIESIEILDVNLDLKPKNQYVIIDWKGFSPLADFPRTIKPNSANTELVINVVYKPDGIDQNAVTIKIVSNDAKHSVRHIVMRPYQCVPAVRVDPSADTFFNATPSNPETKIFKIENEGTCEVTINSIEAMQTSSVFTMHQDFANGEKVLPADEPGYKALEFRVTYQPNPSSTNDKIAYAIYTSDPANNPLIVNLGTQFEGCSYELSYSTQGQGYLDFSQVENSTKTLVVNVLNNGPASFTINTGGVNFPQDPTGSHYTWDICRPQSDGSEICDTTPPVALGEGKSLDIKVTYKAATVEGLNANLTVDYKCSGNHDFVIPAYGGNPKPCFDFAPGTGDSPNFMQFAGEKGVAIKRNFVVYNCGNKDLEVTSMMVEDAFGQGKPSKYWTIENAAPGGDIIPIGGLKVFTMSMLIEDNQTEIGGTLYMKYLDVNDVEVGAVGVGLQGLVFAEGAVVKPTANPGNTADYVGTTVGTPIVLDGSLSTPGSDPIYKNGFMWYLLDKPAGSKIILNGAPSQPDRAVIPDVAGKYVFGLQVHGAVDPFIYSEEATIEINVAP